MFEASCSATLLAPFFVSSRRNTSRMRLRDVIGVVVSIGVAVIIGETSRRKIGVTPATLPKSLAEDAAAFPSCLYWVLVSPNDITGLVHAKGVTKPQFTESTAWKMLGRLSETYCGFADDRVPREGGATFMECCWPEEFALVLRRTDFFSYCLSSASIVAGLLLSPSCDSQSMRPPVFCEEAYNNGPRLSATESNARYLSGAHTVIAPSTGLALDVLPLQVECGRIVVGALFAEKNPSNKLLPQAATCFVLSDTVLWVSLVKTPDRDPPLRLGLLLLSTLTFKE